jgi:hypothetical protein
MIVQFFNKNSPQKNALSNLFDKVHQELGPDILFSLIHLDRKGPDSSFFQYLGQKINWNEPMSSSTKHMTVAALMVLMSFGDAYLSLSENIRSVLSQFFFDYL